MPQYAIAQLGSSRNTPSNVRRAIRNQYEWIIATPRSNSACTLGSQEVGKLSLPSFSSCWPNALQLSAAVIPATSTSDFGFMGASGRVWSPLPPQWVAPEHDFANGMPADGIKHCRSRAGFGTHGWQLQEFYTSHAHMWRVLDAISLGRVLVRTRPAHIPMLASEGTGGGAVSLPDRAATSSVDPFGALDLTAMHDTSRFRIERVPPMQHRKIIPHEQIAHLPCMAHCEARLGRVRPERIEQGLAFRHVETEYVGIRSAAEKQRLPPCVRLRSDEWMMCTDRFANVGDFLVALAEHARAVGRGVVHRDPALCGSLQIWRHRLIGREHVRKISIAAG